MGSLQRTRFLSLLGLAVASPRAFTDAFGQTAVSIFADEFVPNIQAAPYHSKWRSQNSGDNHRWETYRDACIAYKAGEAAPVAPTMSTKYGRALVAAGKEHVVSVTDIGAVWPPTTTPGVVSITGLAPIGGVFRNAGAFPADYSPPQFAELTSSPFGPGYDITCTDSDTQPWPDFVSLKAVLTKTPCDAAYFGGPFEGKHDIWDGYFQLPSSGNAGLPPASYWQPGTFWEFHGDTTSGHTFGLDTHWYPGQYTLRSTFAKFDTSGNAVYDFYIMPPAFQFNHWYHFTWDIVWASTATGSISLKIDGVYPKGLDLPGSPDYNLTNVITMYVRPGGIKESAALQFGWYGARLYGTASNQIQFAGMTLSRT